MQRSALQGVLVALAGRDPRALADALGGVTTSRDLADQELLERALARLLVTRLGPGVGVSAELLDELFRLLLDFGLAFESELAGVFRAMITLEARCGCSTRSSTSWRSPGRPGESLVPIGQEEPVPLSAGTPVLRDALGAFSAIGARDSACTRIVADPTGLLVVSWGFRRSTRRWSTPRWTATSSASRSADERRLPSPSEADCPVCGR